MPRFLPNLTHKTFRRLALVVMTLSCLLLASTIIFWVRSYDQYDRVGIYDRMHDFEFTACRGVFYFAYTRTHDIYNRPPNAPYYGVPYYTTPKWRFYAYRNNPDHNPYPSNGPTTWGFVDATNIETTSNTTVPVGTALAIPAYAFAFLFTLTPFLCFHIYRKNRFPVTHCQSCGYNLTGNPSTPTCPECGRPAIL